MKLRPGRLLAVLSGFAALAVAVTGSFLLWQYRTATLAAAAEREAVVTRARALQLRDDLDAIVAEMTRLSHLAEIDLADGNLEPEKTVLRAARRDHAVFSAAVAILDGDGQVLWAEPRDATPRAPQVELVGLARERGRTAVRYLPGEIDVAAPIAGQGVIVAVVDTGARDLFGRELTASLRDRGAVTLVASGAGGEQIVAAARAGSPPPALRLAAPGQGWVRDGAGGRWLVTEAPVPGAPLALRLVLSASDVEGALAGPYRRLVALVALATLITVAGAALCRDAAVAVRDLAHDCEVDVSLDVPGNGVCVQADATKLLGAIVNLARNGIEAMGPGAWGERLGDAAPARERRLDLKARLEANRAVVEVADRGAGLAPEVRQHLFEPFVTTKRTGTGLGLAIVRRVVEAHGGAIEAVDRPGGGTVFRLALPVEERRA